MPELESRSQPWEIAQQGPPGKTVTLGGASAPHGRRRKAPVADTEFELRMEEFFYPGVRSPGWNIFGDRESPIILRGRFMDSELGPRGALAKLLEVKDLIKDGVKCAIRWGSLLTYVGLPHKIRAGREDAAEIAYELTIKVAFDGDLGRRLALPDPPTSPFDQAQLIADKTKEITDILRKGIAPNEELFPDFLAPFEDLINAVNGAVAEFLHAAEAIDDFESALAGDIRRLVGGIGQVRTAMLTLNQALDNAILDAAIINRTAANEYAFARGVADGDLAAIDILALLADLDVQARRAEQGRTFKTIVAREGDTWEDIARRELGSADAAQSIKDANNIRYAEKPFGGRSYLIPLRT
jgi:hypothetical protein